VLIATIALTGRSAANRIIAHERHGPMPPAQSHPLVGLWKLRIPTGVRGPAGSPTMVDRAGTLSIETVGDSLVALMTLAPVADVASRTMRMSAANRTGKVAFTYGSEARLSNGSDERAAQAWSTYVFEAVGDSLSGVLSQEIEGISGVPDRRFSGTRVAQPMSSGNGASFTPTRPSPTRVSTHPLVGTWDVNVVAGHKDEPDGTVSPITSTGAFIFSSESDSLVVTMQVILSPSRTPIRLATIAASDTATFVRSAQALNAVKGEQNVMSTTPMVSTFRFVAVGDSLRGTMQTTSGSRTNSWPITGKRRTTP
jgi:hypothetical protein